MHSESFLEPPALPVVFFIQEETRFSIKRFEKRVSFTWRCCPDLNWGMKVLQTFALPLGHSTGYEKRNAMRHSYFILSG